MINNDSLIHDSLFKLSESGENSKCVFVVHRGHIKLTSGCKDTLALDQCMTAMRIIGFVS